MNAALSPRVTRVGSFEELGDLPSRSNDLRRKREHSYHNSLHMGKINSIKKDKNCEILTDKIVIRYISSPSWGNHMQSKI